jgi:hypothetical protein
MPWPPDLAISLLQTPNLLAKRCQFFVLDPCKSQVSAMVTKGKWWLTEVQKRKTLLFLLHKEFARYHA